VHNLAYDRVIISVSGRIVAPESMLQDAVVELDLGALLSGGSSFGMTPG
jgi:hypothetical protein